jgi:hypothetical protein
MWPAASHWRRRSLCVRYAQTGLQRFRRQLRREGQSRSQAQGELLDPVRDFHKKTVLRTSADEVQAKDLIIWSNFQHIASIDVGLNDEFLVCQSTAGGPQASRNSFVYHPKQKLFSIEPSPVKFVGKVHIVSVGLS